MDRVPMLPKEDNGDLPRAVTDSAPAQAIFQLGWRPKQALVGKEWRPGPKARKAVPHVECRGAPGTQAAEAGKRRALGNKG